MATVIDVLGLGVIVLVHTGITAIMTRFFRVRLQTRVGAALYTGLLVPVVLLVLTIVFGGVLQLGPNLGTPSAVVTMTVLVPFALGVAFDYFWMPAPDEVDLPTGREKGEPRTRR